MTNRIYNRLLANIQGYAEKSVEGEENFWKIDRHHGLFWGLVLPIFKGVFKSKTVKREIFLPVKELVLIDKYTSSIKSGSLSLFC